MFLEFPKKRILLKFSFQREWLCWSKIYGKTHHIYYFGIFYILTFFLRRKLYDAEIEMTS